LFDNGIQQIDFPPYSPDLNPIENLWNDLKRRVERRNARNVEELKQHVQEEWVATNQEFIKKLVYSMPKRCKAVVKADGHMTVY